MASVPAENHAQRFDLGFLLLLITQKTKHDAFKGSRKLLGETFLQPRTEMEPKSPESEVAEASEEQALWALCTMNGASLCF